MEEIQAVLTIALERAHLAPGSLFRLASIDVKQDEEGLLALAEKLGLSIDFFSKETLAEVKGIANPSAVVAKHVGVTSVCEAAAILSAGQGDLIAPKLAKGNVTVAIARVPSMS